MARMVCVRCAKFLRPKKNGVVIEEGMPRGDGSWEPYKLWMADLYECPGCGVQIVTGFGANAFAEHYQKDYAERRAAEPPLMRRVDDYQ